MPEFDQETATAAAALHASMLVSVDALPRAIDGAGLEPTGTPVHDLNGDVLFWRTPLHGREGEGYIDVGADAAIGAPLVATSLGVAWAPDSLLEQARGARRAPKKYDEVRFVAYSHPKIAVQFLREGQEAAMLELYTWEPVPPTSDRKPGEGPGNFERWSYIDELPARRRNANTKRYLETVRELVDISPRFPRASTVVERIDIHDILRPVTTTRELHFSTRDTDHSTCFELRGQETNVWCVGASVQMLLDYYRYQYTQVRLAQELGLGTLANPNGLPYANDGDVVTVIEDLTDGALDATMDTSPTFPEIRAEIKANRPVISFVPGHARAVAGYTETRWAILAASTYRGLLVFDPWPPTAGVITRWENFDTQSYRRTFTARVTLQ